MSHDKKIPPMIRPGESDDEYDARLQDAGISPEDFESWFEDEFPSSDDDFSLSYSGDDDDDGDAQGDEGKEEFSR